MSTVEPIFQINFTFTNQIITAKQIPIINLNIQNRVLWKSSFKFKTSEISSSYVELDLCTNLNMSKYRTTNFVFLFWFVMQIKIQSRKILSFFCLVWPPPMFKSLSPLWNEVMKDENAQINDFSNTPDRHISIPTWIEHTLKLVRNDNYTLYKLCVNSVY